MARRNARTGAKKNKGKRKARGLPLCIKGQSVTSTPISRVRFPLMPTQFQVALQNVIIDNRVATTTPQNQAFGLFEFLGDAPLYMTQFYAFYKYARIMALTVEVDVINTATVPIVFAMAPIPYSDAFATTTAFELIERPRSRFKTIAGSTGMNRAKLRHTWYALQEFGQPVYGKEYWVDEVQAASTVPQDTAEPLVLCVCQSADAFTTNTYSALVNYKVTYHVEFFDLEGKGTPTFNRPTILPSKAEISMEDMSSY